MIKIEEELAGFALLHREGTTSDVDWNMGEFCVIAKFQGKGIGTQAVQQLFRKHPGLWEITVIPENTPALSFWRKTIEQFTKRQYSEAVTIGFFGASHGFATEEENSRKSQQSMPLKKAT